VPSRRRPRGPRSGRGCPAVPADLLARLPSHRVHVRPAQGRAPRRGG